MPCGPARSRKPDHLPGPDDDMTDNKTGKSLLSIHAAVLLFGTAGLFGKLVAQPSTVIVFGRVLFASLFLVAVSGYRRHPIRLKAPADYATMAALGGLLAVHWVAFFQSIQIATVAVGLLTFSTFPVFVTFLEPLLFKERLRWGDAVIAAVTLFGVWLVVPQFDAASRIAPRRAVGCGRRRLLRAVECMQPKGSVILFRADRRFLPRCRRRSLFAAMGLDTTPGGGLARRHGTSVPRRGVYRRLPRPVHPGVAAREGPHGEHHHLPGASIRHCPSRCPAQGNSRRPRELRRCRHPGCKLLGEPACPAASLTSGSIKRDLPFCLRTILRGNALAAGYCLC